MDVPKPRLVNKLPVASECLAASELLVGRFGSLTRGYR